MKLISYKGTRPGIQAIGSIAVRLGSNSPFSHTEIVFENKDNVDMYMPDGTTDETSEGVWCASASAGDKIPSWAGKRVGSTGGVRFKRIPLMPEHWFVQDLPASLFDPIKAAKWLQEHEGEAYDWRGIAGFLGVVPNLLFHHSDSKKTCAEAVGYALGFPDPWRFHPGNLPPVIERMINPHGAQIDYATALPR